MQAKRKVPEVMQSVAQEKLEEEVEAGTAPL